MQGQFSVDISVSDISGFYLGSDIEGSATHSSITVGVNVGAQKILSYMT